MSARFFLDSVANDFRYALRGLRLNPGFTAVTVLALAVGIGANTAIFSIVDGVLLKPLPFPDSDRLIVMSHSAPGVNVANVSSAPFLYFTEREQNRTLDGVGMIAQGTSTITGMGEPEQIGRLFVTSEILPLLGIEPQFGRYFSQNDDTPAESNTVVITYGYWQRRLGGDPNVIGRTITLDGEPWAIIGVTPQRFQFLGNSIDVITPNRIDRNRVTLGNYFRMSIARLKAGVTIEEASADVVRMIPIAIESFPPGPGSTREQIVRSQLKPNLRPLKQELVGDAGNLLWVLMGTIGILLLIACANVANLLLVRTESRQQELSIRAAIGAGSGRIVRELFTENIVLALAGGTMGIALAYVLLRALLAAAPSNLPRLDEISINSTVLLFTLGVSLLSSVFFGLIPALRYASPHLAVSLRTHNLSASRERLRARGVLVVSQVALALLLLIGAGLMVRTFKKMTDVNPGFAKPEEVQTVRISIPSASVPDPEQTMRREQAILDRLASIPGVTSVAFASDLPMGGGVAADLIMPEGKVLAEGEPPKAAQSRFLSPGLFSTLRMPILLGRDLDWTDVYNRRPVVLISESLARREWGSAPEAMGKRVRGASLDDQFREVVGVVGDVHDRGLSQPVVETVYFPAFGEKVYNNPVYILRAVSYAIRSPRTGTPAFLEEIRRAIWSSDPNLPLLSVGTMGQLVGTSLERTSFTLTLLGIVGGIALLLGAVGIYGVIGYTVSRRTHEVGIRIALGAPRSRIRAIFLQQGLMLASIGVVIGVGAAAVLTRAMRPLLYGVSPLDPATYAAVAAVLIIAAVLATYFPARHAAKLDPVEALRTEK